MTTIKVLTKTIINGTARSPGEVLTVTDEVADDLVRDGSAEMREPQGPRETTSRDDDDAKEFV